jgi:hypothetical protein
MLPMDSWPRTANASGWWVNPAQNPVEAQPLIEIYGWRLTI